MASVDVLEELKLTNYYPQKLSFSEAIKLRVKSQDYNQEQYGLEIVRKLLMLDSAAVVSVTTEINKRLNNTETDNKGQCVSDGGTPQQDTSRSSRRRNRPVQSGRKLHPMDLLVVVMNCCDDFLRQVLVEKMFANKLSIPILLPDIRNGTHTLLLLALRSLIPEVQDRAQEDSSILSDALVDVKNPVVSFIRVGKFNRSKSNLVNGVLNLKSFDTFFHRRCSQGSAKRTVSDGSIEAAWFQSSTEEEFNCKFFTALNLRGDAKDYPGQTQFLCRSSTLIVLMVDSVEAFKELYESTLKDADVSKIKVIVCCSSSTFPETDDDDEQTSKFMDDLCDRGVVYTEIDVRYEDEDVEFANRIRGSISKFFKSEHSRQMHKYAKNGERGKNLGFSLDEDKPEYKSGKKSADEFARFVLNFSPDYKPVILRLQDEPWRKIGKLQREQRGKSENKNQDENFIAQKEMEIKRHRHAQCRSLIQQNAIAQPFSLNFHLLQEQDLLYFINACRIQLDARRRVVISNILEEYTRENLENPPHQSEERESDETKLRKIELKIANSAIGLEHFLREHGQMYEAVISEEMYMREELRKAPLMPDIIRNFPSIVARLLLKGHPLELMDGDASSVAITWLRAVLDQTRMSTNNAKVFVLSIIGVQSSGKSTLLNALFGLQFPVSAGICTKGIYCNLVPVDKVSLKTEFDYILVVDTEGLGSSEFTGKSTFKDNELATFAIGLADATIINMYGENWSEMKDILQVAAHGLIRVRKTKTELEFMPRCMFVHQNVSAVDAEERNQLGQKKQFLLLDEAIKTAGCAEGFPEITKFNQVITYDPEKHSWYFPNLWNGKPPKARTSQDYIAKTNQLRIYLINLMRNSPSKLTISGFSHRMSDLWNAMLHNDFVLCFRNTQEIIASTVLNDRISHQLDILKNADKLEQTKIRELIWSFTSVEEMKAEEEIISMRWRAAADENFKKMKATLQDTIDATAALKQKYEISLQALGDREFRRIEHEMENDMIVHMKKLQIGADPKVKDLKSRLAHLEKQSEEVDKDKFNETELTKFEQSWQQLIAESKLLVDGRVRIAQRNISQTIRGSVEKLLPKYTVQFNSVNWGDIFKAPLIDDMPKVTEKDIVLNQEETSSRSVTNNAYYWYTYTANSKLEEARKMWESKFKTQRQADFDSLHLHRIMSNAGQLMGILLEEQHEARPGADEILCSALPPEMIFTLDYTSRFMEFVWHFAYNRSLENSKSFISLTDPLADVGERHIRSVSNYRQVSAEANSDAVSKQIFEFAKRSFARDLGELIKTEVCKENSTIPTFQSKRAFLKTILTDLGQETQHFTYADDGKELILKKFMLYTEMAESQVSENLFFDLILKLLKETMTKKNASESAFQEMVENNVGEVVEKAKSALRQGDTESSGRAREYIQIFKENMKTGNAIDFRISVMDGFTKAVLEKIDKLYDDYLNQANSLFETLVCEDNKAVLRTVLEKIMGCREKCPFCSAPCSQSLQHHAGDHRANHYPMGVRGTVDSSGWFTSIQETKDPANWVRRKPRKLVIDTCQTMVGSHKNIRTPETAQKYSRWYHYALNWNYQSFKTYKEIPEYANWDIPYSGDPKTSLYWKWFMAQFAEELAQHHKALRPEIPEAWKIITWEEAKESLDDIDLNNC